MAHVRGQRQTPLVADGGQVEEFRSRSTRVFTLYGALLPAVAIVVLAVGSDLPAWTLAFVPAIVALALLLARRQAFVVSTVGVSYCNGIVRHRLQATDISSAVVGRPAGFFAWWGDGIGLLLARYPDQEHPIAAGPIAVATVGLGAAERRRLVTVLTELLGQEATESLSEWADSTAR